MESFARIIVGYHGCRAAFARALLLGKLPISEWQPSNNDYDWLGTGIYFWEHSPGRALRWAKERYGKSAAVIGAVIQLGSCFDLLNEEQTHLLATSFADLKTRFAASESKLPVNRGTDWKLRELDCAVIDDA